jgi:hypothetical protein
LKLILSIDLVLLCRQRFSSNSWPTSDRAPFPVPADFPVYFSVQPGGLIVQGLSPKSSTGIRVIYPNLSELRPGTRALFFDYDPKERDWFPYGEGTVTADGKQVVPNAGVAFYTAMASSYSPPPPPPPPPGPPPPPPPPGPDGPGDGPGPEGGDGPEGEDGGSPCDGDPVACATGTFVHAVTDLLMADVVPLRIDRAYRTNDPDPRLFGRGMSSDYNAFVTSTDPLNQYTHMLLVWGDGSQYRFNRISGTGQYTTSVWEANDGGALYKSRMQWNSSLGQMGLRTAVRLRKLGTTSARRTRASCFPKPIRSVGERTIRMTPAGTI